MNSLSFETLALFRLFDKHSKDGRVILPLLVTVEKLLSHGFFDDLLTKKDSDFSKELAKRIRKEATKISDIKRLMSIVQVAINIFHSVDEEVKSTNLLFLMRILAHRFPRVRRYTAEQLYIKLIEDSSIISDSEDVDKAMDILSNTNWDRDLGPPSNIRQCRNEVAKLLGITLSEKDIIGPKPKAGVKKVDEFATYASLVGSAGF